MTSNLQTSTEPAGTPPVQCSVLLGRLVATKYRIPCENTRDEISIQERRQTNPVEHIKWAVCQWGNVLSKDGEWECEPTPSNRDSDFLTRCRFDSLEDACMAIERLGLPNIKADA
jgi:hypothetical protein